MPVADRSLTKAVQEQPKETAVAMVEKTAVDEQIAVDLVKYLRNPNLVKSSGRKTEYRRARDHFSKADDVGVEWAFRYAACKADDPGPFARARGDSVEVDKLAVSDSEASEKSESGTWSESPFRM